MICCRTFLIGNLTFDFDSVFINLFLLLGVTFKVFLSYFIFLLKNKIKISDISKYFQKLKFSQIKSGLR